MSEVREEKPQTTFTGNKRASKKREDDERKEQAEYYYIRVCMLFMTDFSVVYRKERLHTFSPFRLPLTSDITTTS